MIQNVLCRTGDADRTLQILEEAVSLSYTLSVWPVIALAHFHQYVRGDVRTALRLLKRCYIERTKRNSVPFSSKCSSFPTSPSSSTSFPTSNLFSSSICSKNGFKNIETNNIDREIDDKLKHFAENGEANNFTSGKIEIYKNDEIEKVSLLIALSFCYLENDDIIQSKIFCRRALSLEIGRAHV